jgi:hypothetical protein
LPADATSVLRSIVRVVRGGHDEEHVTHSVNGIVGAALGQTKSTDPAAIFGMLLHKFWGRPNLRDLITHSDFSRFLQIKAVNAANRNKKKEA